ncbi:uncharacterized protein KGF55_000605 [Candida pseudojiufengensis]|uniref:uncharacterized protein n=1 Tax=Candida pseudojiufengensis TaxID=497109 RepID=UPI00222467DC|nr:uncharacterized protein KGF55_000605 [Candida pseudojiufengensis]KAI5966296.1 hypothetical protein KGF55_000605 [Candida pseudojiufengensis]
MTLKIIIPSTTIDVKNDIDKLENLPIRQIVYHDEILQGYIINYKDNDSKSKKTTVYSCILPQNSDFTTELVSQENTSVHKYTFDENQVVFENNEILVWLFKFPILHQRKKIAQPNLYIACQLEESTEPQVVDITRAEDSMDLPNFMPVFNDLMVYSDVSINEQPNQNSLDTTIKKKAEDEKERVKEEIAVINLPIITSLVIKLKTTKPAGRNAILLAALNIECSDDLLHFLTKEKSIDNTLHDIYFEITELNLIFENSLIQPTTQVVPTKIRIMDSLNVIYRLVSNALPNKSSSKPIFIKMSFKVQKVVNGELKSISNLIETEWNPFIDFGLIAPPINNALKTNNNVSQVQSQVGALPNGTNIRQKALLNNIYKLRSPNSSTHSANSLTLSSSSSTNNRKSSSGMPRIASSVTVNLATNVNSSLAGLKLTFIGKLDIQVNQVTNWKIQAVNNSPNRLNLSLLVQNAINFNPIYSTNTTSTNNISSSNLLTMNQNSKSTSNNDVIIQNKNRSYSLYNSLKANYEEEGVIILNNDVRIGPLEPQTVFETNIQLIGNRKGIFNLDGIKIFDINTGDGIDFGKLIEVFVV